MKIFTLEELKKYNVIEEKEIYFALMVTIYDATNSFLWKNGRHMAMHFAGSDLTGCLDNAPHGEDLLKRLPVIGNLKN